MDSRLFNSYHQRIGRDHFSLFFMRFQFLFISTRETKKNSFFPSFLLSLPFSLSSVYLFYSNDADAKGNFLFAFFFFFLLSFILYLFSYCWNKWKNTFSLLHLLTVERDSSYFSSFSSFIYLVWVLCLMAYQLFRLFYAKAILQEEQ